MVNRNLANVKKTKLYKTNLKFCPTVREILVGTLLGDANLNCSNTITRNARLKIDQSWAHKEYVDHLYNVFEPFTNVPPKKNDRIDKRTGTEFFTYYFVTLSFPLFTEYYKLFYNNKIKVVPLNIQELLTPRALAYWIMDDGTFEKQRNRVRIYTDSYLEKEVFLLISAIKTNFDIDAKMHIHRPGQYLINIHSTQLSKLQEIVKPYMHPSLKHKVGL